MFGLMDFFSGFKDKWSIVRTTEDDKHSLILVNEIRMLNFLILWVTNEM